MLDENTPTNELTYNKLDTLAITIAPNDHNQFFYSKKRAQQFYDKYKSIIDTFNSHHYGYWFRCELSEPIGKKIDTKGPRWHIHGILELNTNYAVFDFLNDKLPMLLKDGIISIKHLGEDCDKLLGWVDYCNKQSKYIPVNMYYSSRYDNTHGEYYIKYPIVPPPAPTGEVAH